MIQQHYYLTTELQTTNLTSACYTYVCKSRGQGNRRGTKSLLPSLTYMACLPSPAVWANTASALKALPSIDARGSAHCTKSKDRHTVQSHMHIHIHTKIACIRAYVWFVVVYVHTCTETMLSHNIDIAHH